MTSSEDASARGPRHVFPARVDESMTIQGTVVFGPSPWGVPGGMGMVGERSADTESLLTLIFESPQEQFYAVEPITKEASEQIQLERLRTDFLWRGMGLPFGAVERGPDPTKAPDFVVPLARQGQSLGIDVTRLSITERMTAQALFRRLRQAILSQPRHEFVKLTGSVVYLWFDENGFSSLPPKQDDAVEALLAGLRGYEFDPELTIPDISEGMPEQMGDIGQDDSVKGAHFYAIPMSNGTPSSHFYLSTGFELGLAFQTTHDVASAWQSITRLVDSHDNPETQILIISVGAPDRRGLSYPSETALMSFALEQPAPAPIEPNHVQEVLLHSWLDGAVNRVYPVIDCVAAPLYQGGFVPAHFSLCSPFGRGLE